MALKKPGDIFKHPQAKPVFTNISNIEEQLSKAEVLLPKEKVEELKQQLESVTNSIDTSLSEVADGSVDFSVVKKELDRFNSKIIRIESDLNEKVDDLRQKHTDIKTGIQIVQTRQNNIHPEKLKEEVIHRVKNILIGDIGKNIRELEERVDVIKGSYKQTLSEGLLNEPPTVNNSDPLTPLNKKFVTLDEFQSHYKLFINRIQTQLATLGGGGAVNIREMDDVDHSTARVNGKYLKYNSTTNKWEGADASGGGGGGSDGVVVQNSGSGIGTATTINFADNLNVTAVSAGIVTVTGSGANSFSGITTFNNDVIFQGAAAAQKITFDHSENDLEFSDAARIKFGNSDDLEIWHDAPNSHIKNSTGDFKIRSDSLALKTADDSEKYLKAVKNEDVKLYYNGNEKFATANTGAVVTGIVTATQISDSNGSVGSASSVLSSTGSGLSWVAQSGGTLQSRTTTTATTGSIAQAASTSLTIPTAGKSFSLMKVTINAPAWVVLYIDSASRTSDASRTEGADPAPGSGVITEVSTTASGATTFNMTPAVLGWNNDGTPAAQVYAKVVNKRATSGSNTITVTLTNLALEA